MSHSRARGWFLRSEIEKRVISFHQLHLSSISRCDLSISQAQNGISPRLNKNRPMLQYKLLCSISFPWKYKLVVQMTFVLRQFHPGQGMYPMFSKTAFANRSQWRRNRKKLFFVRCKKTKKYSVNVSPFKESARLLRESKFQKQ